MADSAIDEVQSHILGVAAGLLVSYGLTPAQLETRYDYIRSLSQDQITNMYETSTDCAECNQDELKPLPPLSPSSLWGDYELEEDANSDSKDDILYVTTRRDFCMMMQKGIKICPRYSSCEQIQCSNFHIQPEYICSHANKGSYCDIEGCDLIVIRPCRKGKKCSDADCSFRHP